MRPWTLALLLACVSCADAPEVDTDQVDEDSAPAGVCPDEGRCVAACGGELALPGVCGWTWGEPACVCGAAPCDADACYGHEDADRVCGLAPDGAPVEACIPR